MLCTASIAGLATPAEPNRASTPTAAALQLGHVNEAKGHATFAGIPSYIWIYHDIHWIKIHPSTHLTIDWWWREGSCAGEELVQEVRPRFKVWQCDPSTVIDAGPAAVCTILPVFRGVFGSTMLDASRAGTLHPTGAS